MKHHAFVAFGPQKIDLVNYSSTCQLGIYVDQEEATKKTGLGFVPKDGDDELKVNISNAEVDRLLKEYKKIKKSQKSNLSQIKKLGLVDKHGNPLK